MLRDRVAGALLGVAVGDALGSTLEFMTREEIRAHYGRHSEMVGGGAFGWRPGQGTDDTDMTAAVLRAYLDGYSLERVAGNFLAWYASRPPDIGTATQRALEHLRRNGDPRQSGEQTWNEYAAGNGSLMRCIPTALARPDAGQRRAEAREISAITHSDRRCVDACVAYCDLVALLVEGHNPADALEEVLGSSPVGEEVREAVRHAGTLSPHDLSTSGYVLSTLQVGVWALLQETPFEETLIEVVNLGDDADTTGAVAGGLLGAWHGRETIPQRWLQPLEYRREFEDAVPRLVALSR